MTLNELMNQTGLTRDAIRELLNQKINGNSPTFADIAEAFGSPQKTVNHTVETDVIEGDDIVAPVPFTPIGVPKRKVGRPKKVTEATENEERVAFAKRIGPKPKAVRDVLSNGMRTTITPSPSVATATGIYRKYLTDVYKAIQILRQYNEPYLDKKTGKMHPPSLGVHVVFTSFNAWLTEVWQCSKETVIERLNEMALRGDVAKQVTRTGPIYFLPGDYKPSTVSRENPARDAAMRRAFGLSE